MTANSTPTTSPLARNYSNVTTTSVRPVAPISNASALSGDLSGTLGPGFESVDVPLRGPGDWTLSASASTNQSLNCGADTSPVVEPSRRGHRPELSTGDRFFLGRDRAHVATHSRHLKRLVAPLQGSALAVYFVLLPYVVVTKWHRTQRQDDGTLVRVLLVALALFWLVFLSQVVRDVWRLRRGASAGTGGSAWLAAGLVALLSLFLPSSAGAASLVDTSSHGGERPPAIAVGPRAPRVPECECPRAGPPVSACSRWL